MKPFLLLTIRAERAAADDEYDAFLRFTGLPEAALRRVRLEQAPLGRVDLGAWSGVLLGGGPFNVSDPETSKSPVQRRVEAELHDLMRDVVAADHPFLGACYGIGTLGAQQGAVVDRRYAEPISRVPVTLTDAGRADQLFGVLPEVFDAFVGHKESVRGLPPHAVHLASAAACPVQAFRVGAHAYATQFHPELDIAGLCTRIDVYRHAGYFEPDEAESLQAMARASVVRHPPRILRRFVELFATDRRHGDDGARDDGAGDDGTGDDGTGGRSHSEGIITQSTR